MKTKHSVWKTKLAKTMPLVTAILVAALFFGTAAGTGIAPSVTPTEKINNITTSEVTPPVVKEVVSADRAPQSSAPIPEKKESLQTVQEPVENPLLFEPFYASDVLATPHTTFSFLPSAPGTITPIGTYTITNFLSGGTFDNNGVWWGCEYNTASSNVYTIDTTTGALTLVGAAGVSLNGISVDKVSGIMYGVGGSSLYTINMDTGVATVVGPTGSALYIDICIDGEGNAYGIDLISDSLYSIDLATGASTLIGSMGIFMNYAQDGCYDIDEGILYMAAYTGSAALYTVNTATGAATLVGAFPGGEIDCFAIPYESIPADHDMGVKDIEEPSSGTARVINPLIEVKNFGNNTETNVPVNLLISRKQVNGTTNNFELNDGGYTHAAGVGGTTPGTDAWEYGTPTSGPMAAHSGVNLWATILAGNYQNYMYANLTTPAFVVPTNGYLEFWHWYSFESSWDGGNVKISNNSWTTWTLLTPTGGYPGTLSSNPYMTNQPGYTATPSPQGWRKAHFDFPAALYGQTVQLRFSAGSDGSVQYPGWYIDDVTIGYATWINEYNQTAPIASILSGETLDFIGLPNWTPFGLGVTQNVDMEYSAEARVTLAGDMNPDNDFRAETFTLHFGWLHDISVDKIVAPPVTGKAQTYIPKVNISNLGQNNEVSVPVRMIINKNQYTTLMSETFVGTFPPTGWTQEAAGEWTQSMTANAGGTSPEARLYWANIVGNYAFLQSPAVDTSTATILQLKFRSYLDVSGPIYAKVLVLDSLSSWIDVTPWANPVSADLLKALYTIDVSALKGTATQVMFEFTGPNINVNNWYVDNVQFINKVITTEKNQVLYVSPLAGAKVQLTYSSWTPADLHLIENVDQEYEVNVTATLATDGYQLNNKIIQFTILHFDSFNDIVVNSITKPVSGLAAPQIPMVNLSNVGQNDQGSVNVNMVIEKAQGAFINEPFTGSFPPAGWATNNAKWMQSNTANAGGVAPEAMFSWTPSETGDFRLYTFALDTTGETTLPVSFKEYVNDYNGAYTLKVQTSIDGGATWIDAYSRPGGAYGPATTSLTLNATHGVGSSALIVAFTFSGNSFNINYWYIDDVQISEPTFIEEYDETVATSINAYQTKNVTFPSWTPADMPIGMNIQYRISVNATIAGYTSVWSNSFDYSPAIPPTFPPAGWTRVAHSGTLTWQINNYWVSPRTNLAGTGLCADADADKAGSGGPWPMNCSLVTPVIDLTGKTQANLTYGAYYYLFSGDYAKTEITTNGGATWTAIKTVLGYISGAEAVTIDLTAYVGGPVQIRFHYFAPGWDYYWEVDNVKVMADSTVMLFQNFDGATIPATWNGWWSTITSGTSTLKWQPVQTGTSPTCVPHTGSWMAKYPSYSISSGSARMMYNFSFDLTSYGSSDLAIGFWMMHDTGYAGYTDQVQVQVSTDNVTWVNVGAPINRYDATATTPTWKPHFVDISAYATETTVWIAFHGISDYGNNIYIDDAAIAKLVTVPDATPANNVKTKWILLSYEHDVGVSEITEPTAPHETGIGKWDSDTTTNAMSDGGYLFEAAIRFNVTDMIGFNGWDLKKVQFFKGYGTTAVPACSGNIKIYSSTNASQPETLETTEPWSVGVGSFWVNVTLSHPVNIQPGLDYWVSVEYAAGYTSYPAGCDLGPAVDFKGDWLWDEVTPWTEMQVWGFNYNWHIRAHFETVAPTQWLPGTYQVAGIVKNFGFTYPETNFVVNAKIFHLGSPDVLVYEENVTVTQTLAAPDGTAPVTFPNITIDNVTAAEGNYRVEIKTMLPGDDHPNNDKQTKTFTIFLPDVLPPITTHSFSGTMGDNDWYISDTSITLTATDPFPPFIRGGGPGKSPSGVNHTYYKVDAGAWTEYTQPVVVSTDGQHQVWYYSVDKVGNTEAEKGPFAFKIDKTAPVWTNYSFTPLNFMKNKWLCSAVVEDATSGVVLVEFYVDDALVGSATAEPWEFEFDGKPTTSSQGLAYDAAGNSALSPIASYVEYEYQPHSNPLQQKLI